MSGKPPEDEKRPGSGGGAGEEAGDTISIRPRPSPPPEDAGETIAIRPPPRTGRASGPVDEGDTIFVPGPGGASIHAAAPPPRPPSVFAEEAGPEAPAEGRDYPEWIAGHRILGKLGEGGMGVVYQAEQQDPRRLVALKVIRGGAIVDDYQIKLFKREAQTLARLRHPSIAAIYEGGRTDDGQHYFAMEMVHGVPLDEYLRLSAAEEHTDRGSRSTIAARLALFLKICEAIGYAHQRGVIHRDLKPSNIFVVTDGEALSVSSTGLSLGPQVKILDFGLARMTDAETGPASLVTEVGRIQGTLAYMSPEQARGNPDEIDVRTDVYALGVILFEMLTGEPPYDVRQNTIYEAVRVICEEPARRASALVNALRGDVETILVKALEKEPARRYQSATALADDVGRYLTNQPILARPPSTTYQLRKLVARHRTLFGFLTTLFVLLVGFGITMAVMFDQQRRARREAVIAAGKVEQVNQFLQDMLSSVDPRKARGRDVTVRDVLEEASTRIEKELVDQPEIRAAAEATIGRTYMALGQYDAAEPHLRDALETQSSVLGRETPEVARSLDAMGLLLWKQGKYDAAEPALREALATNRKVLAPDHPEIAENLNNLANLRQAQGQYAEAESLFKGALGMRRQILEPEDPRIAESLSSLAQLLNAQGRYAEAEPLFREAIAMQRKSLGEDHPDVALNLVNLAALLKDEAKYTEAEPLYREALSIQERMLGTEHPDVATAMNNLALLLREQGAYAEAESLLRGAIAINRKLLGEEHPSVAGGLNNLARVLQAEGKLREAEVLYQTALTMVKKLVGEEHPVVATGLFNLASVRQAEKKYDEAEAGYEQALAMRKKLLGEQHPDVATALSGLASLWLDRGRPAKAEPLLRESLAIRTKAFPPGDWRVALTENILGGCLVAAGRYAEAESLLVRSEALLKSAPNVPPARRREASERCVRLYEAWGKPELAAPYREALHAGGAAPG